MGKAYDLLSHQSIFISENAQSDKGLLTVYPILMPYQEVILEPLFDDSTQPQTHIIALHGSPMSRSVNYHTCDNLSNEGLRLPYNDQMIYFFQVSSMSVLNDKYEKEIKDNDTMIKDLKSQLDKHSQIAAMIHNLSSGKIPCNSLNFSS